jgi:hypothetical protein
MYLVIGYRCQDVCKYYRDVEQWVDEHLTGSRNDSDCIHTCSLRWMSVELRDPECTIDTCREIALRLVGKFCSLIIIAALNLFLAHLFQNMTITNRNDPGDIDHWHMDAREICGVPYVCRNEAVHRQLGCGRICELLLAGDYAPQHGLVSKTSTLWDVGTAERRRFQELYLFPYQRYVAAHYPNALKFDAKIQRNATSVG